MTKKVEQKETVITTPPTGVKSQTPEEKKSKVLPVVLMFVFGCFLFAMLVIGLFIAAIFFTSKRSTEKIDKPVVETQAGENESGLLKEEQPAEEESTTNTGELDSTTAEIDAALEEIDRILNEMDSASGESDNPPTF